MYHMEEVAKLGREVGITYVGICGGAIRGKGIQEGDYGLLGAGLDEAVKVFDTYGIKATQDECDAICIGTYIVNEKAREKIHDWSD